MNRINRRSMYWAVAGLAVACVVWFLIPDSTAARRDGGIAKTMLASLGTTSGLCVHLGVQDGTVAMALSHGGQYLVHGVATSREAVDRARRRIVSAGLAGVVSVELGSVKRLPYADRLVNLLVADDLPRLLDQGLKLDEVLRVLRPGGVAWLGQRAGNRKNALTRRQLRHLLTNSGLKNVELIEHDGLWAKIVNPRPASMDQWTHKRYDATGNPASKDKAVGLPSGVRWVAGPNWPTGYRKSAVPGVVASPQRLVYIFQDEVQTPDGPKLQDSLIARDAYNGLILWKRKTTKSSTALVTVGERVYTVLQDAGPLVALDANTGEIVRRYRDVIRPRRVLYVDGALLADLPDGLVCLDADSGKSNWKHPVRTRQFVAGDGRVFFHVDARRKGGASQFGCLDLKTGKEQWKESTDSWCQGTPELVFYQAGVLVFGGRKATHAVSAKDGSHLWSHKYPLIGHGGKYTKVMYTNGLVWVHAAGFEGNKQYAWEGLNPLTGKVEKRVVQPKDFYLKHRCNYDVATGRYFMCGSMDFADIETGQYSHFTAARNSCAAAGILPANGLLYTFPHACGCYAMLRGFLGLATSETHKPDPGDTPASRLQTGPAFDTVPPTRRPLGKDWPTYRHDTLRSGSSTAAGPTELNKLWENVVDGSRPESLAAEWDLKDGGRVSSPVIAEGLAFVAATDSHRVFAFDAKTGEPRWGYAAGGRVDCPPTIYQGLCLFGSRDGWVYCLRVQDGQLVWRFRAAPREKRIVAYGQLESPWPVAGGVLLFDGLAYFVAGRHSGSDGGVFVSAVEPQTGKLIWSVRPEGYPGVPDVLNGDGHSIQMASWQFDAKTGKNGKAEKARLRGGRLGLLNDAWYKRPIALRKNLQLWSAGKDKRGQMLAFNQTATCGFKACSKVDGGRGKLSGDAELFATLASGGSGKGWSIKMPNDARLRGMVLTQTRLYVAGRLYSGNSASNVVRAYSVANGKPLGRYRAAGRFIHDCLAVAGDRLYASTQGGKLICLGVK